MFKTKNTMILLILIAYSTINAYTQQETRPEIYYGGEKTSEVGSYTFTYHIISKSYNITKWQLRSSFFKRTDIQIQVIAQDELDDSPIFEPLFITNPSLGNIEFNHESDHKFIMNTIRTYNLTVYINTYIAIPIDEIEYQILCPPGTPLIGVISGPVNPDELIDSPWYYNIPPTVIPIVFIILLIIAWRLKWV